MRRGPREWLQDMAIIAVAVALGLFVAWGAHAQEPPPPLPLHIDECKLPACAIVSGPQAAALVIAYDDAVRKIGEIERQLRELKVAKGCAKLEVTEPPRNFIPKREHES